MQFIVFNERDSPQYQLYIGAFKISQGELCNSEDIITKVRLCKTEMKTNIAKILFCNIKFYLRDSFEQKILRNSDEFATYIYAQIPLGKVRIHLFL